MRDREVHVEIPSNEDHANSFEVDAKEFTRTVKACVKKKDDMIFREMQLRCYLKSITSLENAQELLNELKQNFEKNFKEFSVPAKKDRLGPSYLSLGLDEEEKVIFCFFPNEKKAKFIINENQPYVHAKTSKSKSLKRRWIP
jgi:hypothetical protein